MNWTTAEYDELKGIREALDAIVSYLAEWTDVKIIDDEGTQQWSLRVDSARR